MRAAPRTRGPHPRRRDLPYARGVREAVLFDIHGNVDALEAVLAEADDLGCAGLVLGGDYAFLGPAPAECVDRLRDDPRPAVAIRGNTDRMIAEGGDPIGEWAADRLGPERVRWLGGLPGQAHLSRHAALLVHATPRSDEERLLPDTPDPQAAAMLAGVDVPTLLCGHVHLQHRRTVDGLEVVNPGSVGFPFDGDPRAAWAVIEDGAVELRRSAYDVERALDRLATAVSHPERALAERRLRTARA